MSGHLFRGTPGITGHEQFAKDDGIIVKRAIAWRSARRSFCLQQNGIARIAKRRGSTIDRWGIPSHGGGREEARLPTRATAAPECLLAHPPSPRDIGFTAGSRGETKSAR